MSILKTVIFVTLCAILVNDAFGQDNPCQARKYNQSSIVCVCSAEYCDEVSKVNPLSPGKYVLYSSSNEGQRFEKSFGNLVRKTIKPKIPAWGLVDWLNKVSSFADAAVIEINRDVTYQTIEGFGGSFTDAAGINLQTLSQGAQDNFVKSYFSEKGLEYNVGRVPIGGSDFSTHPYAYNMQPTDDLQLSNFSLTEEDYTLKLPLIQQAIAHATEELHILATAWSPPVWMKTNGEFGGESRLIDKYYQTWADYHLRFLQEYKKNNVSIWAISTGNEPSNGIIPILAFNSLGWMPSDQARWVAENLGPTIKHSEFKDVNILALDDQRFSLPWWIEWLAENNDTMQYIDGVAVHWYWNDLIGPSSLDRTHNAFPDKFLIGTEACVGDKPWQTEKVELGSWSRAEMYVKDILEGLNHWYVGWIDWNLALSREGGPNWFNNFVDAGVIVMPDADEFLKQPLFYAVGHFSKFIPRGSVRVEVKELTGFVDHVAFLRPDNGIVVVFYNPYDSDKTLTIQEKDKGNIQVDVPARSVHSLIYW